MSSHQSDVEGMSDEITEMEKRVSALGGRKLTEEESNIIRWLENAKNDIEIIEAAKSIRFQEHIGPIMAACRKRAGLAQEQLAVLLHYESHSTISKLESNSQTLKIDLLRDWTIATNSLDAAMAFSYGEIGMAAMIKKLKSTGYLPE